MHRPDGQPPLDRNVDDLEALLRAASIRGGRAYSWGKRAFDLAVGFGGLLLLSPVVVLLAIAVCLDSRGSPFFLQDRLGRDRKVFRIIKLRTMLSGSSGFALSPRDGKDPRLTRLGFWLRKTSADELPQLWNVLVGDLALIGPRPIHEEEVQLRLANMVREEPSLPTELHERLLDVRFRVPQGLAGLPQATGRSELRAFDTAVLDVEYVAKASMTTDLILAVRVIWAAILGRGSN